MANLNDLYDAIQNKTFENLRCKIEMALLIKAQATLAAVDAPESRKAWAKNVFNNSEPESQYVLKYIIGLNNSQNITNMSNDNDSTVKTNVNTTIDMLYPNG
jgi:hypothetical protein